MKLDDLVVHPRTARLLEQFIASPSHAVLIHGGLGLGKTQLARGVAAALLGTSPEDIDRHEYFRAIAPEDGITTTIDQVRSLRTFVRLKVPGSKSTSRVVLLDDADTLNIQAQNALLKLLEEPPAGTVLLLVSSRPSVLLPTVRSRLQDISVHTPSEDQLVTHFSAHGHTETDIRRAILLSDESIAAMHIRLKGEETQNDIFDTVKSLLRATSFERLCQIDVIAKDKIAAKQFVQALQQLAAASMLRAAVNQQSTTERWYGIVQAAQFAEQALRYNGNTKLVLTDLVLAL